MSTEALF
jgi:hypothetical protein